MSKEAYYFSHDANARRDPEIVQLISVYGWEGYGWYWAIVEMMREQEGYKLNTTSKYFYQGLAKELLTDADKMLAFIDDCVNEFNVMRRDDTFLWTDSLLKRMAKYQKSVEQRREAGKKSAEKRMKDKVISTPVERPLQPKATTVQQLKETKLKETKGKEDKHIETIALIISDLNEVTGKSFKPTTAETIKMIHGRLSEGYTLDDFKRVHEVKQQEWGNDPEMEGFLRPSTLYRPSNFEGYINKKTPQDIMEVERKGQAKKDLLEKIDKAYDDIKNREALIIGMPEDNPQYKEHAEIIEKAKQFITKRENELKGLEA